MKFFWFGIVLLAFCAICEVISDYSDSMLPLKEIRNRVHRTMRMNMRVGKRFGDSEYEEEAPKRRLRWVIRTGKRALNPTITPNTFTPLYTDDPDIDSDNTDFKRSSPQFLLNPRVGKNDKTWKIQSPENLHKRSDPKATDMWFGPRIGRSNEEPYDDLPWAYVLLNGNRPANTPVFKSNEVEEQSRDDLQE